MNGSTSEQLQSWLGRVEACACGRTHRVDTRLIRLDDVRGSVLTHVLESLKVFGPIAVIADEVTFKVAGEAIVKRLRAAGRRAIDAVLPGSVRSPDEAAMDALVDRLGKAPISAIIGVGSGTLNDLAKTLSAKRGCVYVSYPTAASMNGYTSSIAALKRDGLKVTQPVRAPDAVVVDLDVLAAAPRAMTAAGFADLLSKEVCHADWRLARLVEGAYHCRVPASLASQATGAAIEAADAIGRSSREGVATLTEALLLSGVAMSLAGSSSPASGGEHLISHYWDMTRPGTGDRRFHGTQVGLGILICAALYERLSQLTPEQIAKTHATTEAHRPAGSQLERAIREHFGAAAKAVAAEALEKYLRTARDTDRRARIRASWADVAAILDAVRPVASVRALLMRAGAPTTVRQLGLDAKAARDALRWARHIRTRYTLFDFAHDIGHFSPDDQRAVLHDSGVLD